MALAPMIIVGCGGLGGRVVVGLRQRLELELRRLGWDEGLPDAWQLLYVDTPGTQESHLAAGAPLPDADYVSLSGQRTVYPSVDEAVIDHAAGRDALDRLVGWRPQPRVPLQVEHGAGQSRAMGRIVGLHGLTGFARRFEQALASCDAGHAQLQRLGEVMGEFGAPTNCPYVVVISSLAGGTGAGVLIDVCDVARAIDPDLQDRIMSVLFSPDVFHHVHPGSGLAPNALASLSELMAGHFDRSRSTEPLYRGVVETPDDLIRSSGPSYPFVIGMETMAGQRFADLSQCSRAVTETLAATVLSSDVLKSLFEFQITNWTNNALPNVTKWSFGNPTYAGAGMRAGPMLSSFGSSRVSVGSTLFGEYAAHRLTRETVEFLIEGYLSGGQQLPQDTSALRDEIVRSVGPQFVGDCRIRELNDPDAEHDQVLDVVLPPEEIRGHMRSWWTALSNELAGHGSLSKGQWLQVIRDVVPNRLPLLTAPVQREVDEHIAQLALELPARMVDETSRVMSELGVPVARELVAYAGEHVRQSVKQLRYEAAEARRRGAGWGDAVEQALARLEQHEVVPLEHVLIGGDDGAAKQATIVGYQQIRALGRDRAADLLERFANQVLIPLAAELDQVLEQLGGPDSRAEISQFPADSGVPVRFSPAPFDFCLIPVEEWPGLYRRLVTETAQQEHDERFVCDVPETTVRRMVVGGGFTVRWGGRAMKVPAAIRLSRTWDMQEPVQFETSLGVADITDRAREWVGRDDTVIGQLISQSLDTYLRPAAPDGSPLADHDQRLARFEQQLSAAVTSAVPLVAIDAYVFSKVHPHGVCTANLEAQPLPVRGRAREIAERVLGPLAEGHRYKELDDFFGDGTNDSESVSFVSILNAPVHPSVVMSLTQPITAAWQPAKSSREQIERFWRYRRARVLPEAIPVAPGVLRSMIMGWFLGRALGMIPDPNEHDGFAIGTADGVSRFPWPLLRCGQVGTDLAARHHQRDWLPAILESLGLAYMLVPADPTVLDAYEALYQTGSRAEIVMDRWIAKGSIDGAIADARVRYSGPNDETYDALRTAFEDTARFYANRIETTTLRPDSDDDFDVDFGYSLYAHMIAALGELIDSIPQPWLDLPI